MSFSIQRNTSIREYHSFNFPIIANTLVRVNSHRGVVESMPLVKSCNYHAFLGSGSNTVFAKNYDGCVVQVNIKGKIILNDDDDSVLIQAAAGENWADFVDWTIDNNYPGLENLAMIPGTVGASPVQNIGAYGVEIKSFIDRIVVFDYERESFIHLPASTLDMRYRWSKLKTPEWKNILITDVVFRLPKKWSPQCQYQQMGKLIVSKNPSPREIRDVVCKLRMEKLPPLTPEQHHAGSFFRNLIVSPNQLLAIKEKYPDIPIFPERKIPIGWLLEKRGWKGKSSGNVGVSDKHALVLTHNGRGKAEELVKLFKEIQIDIMNDIGITIEPEVTIHGL